MDQSIVHALTLSVDRSRRTTLPVQLAEQIRDRVRGGGLAAGARLPSSRAVADAIGVSRAVAGAAYDQLVAEGWLETRQGAGTFVRRVEVPGNRPVPARPLPGARARDAISLRAGEPWTPTRPSAAWRRAWREVAHAAPPGTYPDPRGLPELRTAVAEQLSRTRGLPCSPDRLMITSGTTHGLGLLLRALRRPEAVLAVEDPGYRAAAATAEWSGWGVWDVPVDSEGLDTAFLAGAPANVRAVYATPSHQYPLGVLMPIQRRLDLLAWARERDAYVIEDDYDSEFRYDVAPLPTLADLDRERVVYLGTVSKTLGAGIRMGWLVAPPALVEAVAQAREVLHDFPPWPIQRAMLSLLRDGEWDRSVRAARRRYAQRDRLIERRLAAFGELCGVGGGIHTTLRLEPRVAAAVSADAASNGVDVPTLTECTRSRTEIGGLLIGYGTATDAQFDRAMDLLVAGLARTLCLYAARERGPRDE